MLTSLSRAFHPLLQATVKRGGDYTGGVRGEVSFNGDLGAPMLDAIAVVSGRWGEGSHAGCHCRD